MSEILRPTSSLIRIPVPKKSVSIAKSRFLVCSRKEIIRLVEAPLSVSESTRSSNSPTSRLSKRNMGLSFILGVATFAAGFAVMRSLL